MAITYQPQYRLHATTTWINWGSPISGTSATIGSPATPLTASTQYDVQVIAINSFGSTTSNLISATTAAGVTVSSIVLSGSKAFTTGTNNAVVGTIAVTMSSGSFTGTLGLSGADALSFQIVNVSGTNTLETKGILNTAKTYTVNIVATQSGATNSPFTGASESIVGTAATTSVIPITPPANLPTGWQIAFFDDFTTNTTITTTSSSNGFNWYANTSANSGGGGGANLWSVQTTTQASAIASVGVNNASSNGGIWVVSGTTSTTTYNGNWLSCIPASGVGNISDPTPTTGVNGKNNYWKHFYVEAYMQWSAAPSNHGGTWFPAFWSWSLHSVPTPVEIDFMEGGNTSYNDSVYDPGGGPPRLPGGQASVSINNNWHTYACLWQATSSTTGTIDFYLDGNHVGNQITTGSGGTSTSTFAADMENVTGQGLTMGSGNNWPLNIDWVRVWTATGT